MRARWTGRTGRDYLSDALTQLTGWTHDGWQIKRTLVLDEAQHVALTERIQVVADVLHVRPEIRRLEGHTQIKLGCRNGSVLSEDEVTLAARIEEAYRTVMITP